MFTISAKNQAKLPCKIVGSYSRIFTVWGIFDDYSEKGLVKPVKRVKIAHSFLVFVKSVPCYHFKLAYVVLQMAAKNFSKTTSKNREIVRFNWSLLIESF